MQKDRKRGGKALILVEGFDWRGVRGERKRCGNTKIRSPSSEFSASSVEA